MTYQEVYKRNLNTQSEPSGGNFGESPSAGSDDSFDFQEYLAIIHRRRWAMLATILVVVILGMLYTLTRKPVYESTAMILVVTHGSSGSGGSGDFPLLNDLQALTQGRSIDTQQEIISSQDLLDKAYKNLSAATRKSGFNDDPHIPEWSYKITTKKDTDVLVVACRAYTKWAAVELANGIADTYFKQDLERNSHSTSQARIYAEDQMASIEKELRRANISLAQYKQKSGLIDASKQLEVFSEYIAKLNADLDDSKHQYAANQRAISTLRQQLGRQKEQVLSQSTMTNNPEFMSAVENINQLNMKRAAAMQVYTVGSKEVKQLDGQINSEQARLKRIAGTIVGSKTTARNPIWDSMYGKYTEALVNDTALSTRIHVLGNTLDSLMKQSTKLPNKERELSERMQKVAMLANTYEMLSQKYYALLITERSMLPNGELVSQARPATRASSPRKARDGVLFILLGAVLSLIVAIVLDRMDIRVHDQAYVERVTGLPTLGVVPLIEDDTPRLISDADNNSTLLESYRILRSNVAFSSIDREIKLLAVSGPGRGEGKSTNAANIAIAMAMDGKKVLIVDCDMRRPSLHRVFGVSRSVGLTNVVTKKAKVEDAIFKTKIENLSVLPSGPIPPNPPEVLNSTHCRELLRGLTNDYDLVLLDCPPCAGLSDVQVVSTMVDGLLLIVSINQTLKPHLLITMQTLARVDAPVIGTVLNKMDVRRQGYYYYYYSYNYSQEAGDQKPTPQRKKRRRGSDKNSSEPVGKV